ncbi:hypothetical protein [Sphingomonas crusticola]|uniref:hypothetical protein n=1 Tax=Sphingomonas crusticola TaxID=1697973 RepID=UPI000E227EFA|nr:hypothetical protein [Sphingomonas crusticola]
MADNPTPLTRFELPQAFYLDRSLAFPTAVVLTGNYHRNDEVDIHLDRPILTDTGLTSTLRFVASSDPVDFSHYVPPFTLVDAAGFSLAAQRGDYHIVDVTVVQAATGAKIVYSTQELAAMSFSTGFSIRSGTPNDFDGGHLSDILWLNRSGATSTWLANEASGSLHFEAKGRFNDQTVDPSWKAVETMNFAGTNASILWRNSDGSLAVCTGRAR